MTEQSLRRLLESKGYESDDIEDVVAQWADEFVDRQEEENHDQQRSTQSY